MSNLWLKHPTLGMIPVGGGDGGGGGFDGEHVLTGDPNDPPAELQVGQLLWDGYSSGEVAPKPGDIVFITSQRYRLDDGFMDTSYDVQLATGEQFAYDVQYEAIVSGISMKPDRQFDLSCMIYTNNIAAPWGGGMYLDANEVKVPSNGTNWTYLAGLTGAFRLPANAPAHLACRLNGVTGGATVFSYEMQVTLIARRLS